MKEIEPDIDQRDLDLNEREVKGGRLGIYLEGGGAMPDACGF